jgi:hypothetical protein
MVQLETRGQLLDAVRELRADLDQVIAEAGEERIEQAGSFDERSLKDVIAHLTGWRQLTAARLEAGMADEEPVYHWPDRFDEAEDLHAINRWFFETNRDKPLDQVLAESNESFDRIEHAIATISEEALLTPGRFDWIFWTEDALGPAVVGGMVDHYRVEHADIRAWLIQGDRNIDDL